jgi:hypothetical protein
MSTASARGCSAQIGATLLGRRRSFDVVDGELERSVRQYDGRRAVVAHHERNRRADLHEYPPRPWPGTERPASWSCPPCHSRSRRHAVTPEHPSSPGSIRHGTPVTSTKRMAVNAMRSSTRGRPIRGDTRAGNSGSSTAPSASSTCSDSATRRPQVGYPHHPRIRAPACDHRGLLKPLLSRRRVSARIVARTSSASCSSAPGSASSRSATSSGSTRPACIGPSASCSSRAPSPSRARG